MLTTKRFVNFHENTFQHRLKSQEMELFERKNSF